MIPNCKELESRVKITHRELYVVNTGVKQCSSRSTDGGPNW